MTKKPLIPWSGCLVLLSLSLAWGSQVYAQSVEFEDPSQTEQSSATDPAPQQASDDPFTQGDTEYDDSNQTDQPDETQSDTAADEQGAGNDQLAQNSSDHDDFFSQFDDDQDTQDQQGDQTQADPYQDTTTTNETHSNSTHPTTYGEAYLQIPPYMFEQYKANLNAKESLLNLERTGIGGGSVGGLGQVSSGSGGSSGGSDPGVIGSEGVSDSDEDDKPSDATVFSPSFLGLPPEEGDNNSSSGNDSASNGSAEDENNQSSNQSDYHVDKEDIPEDLDEDDAEGLDEDDAEDFGASGMPGGLGGF